MGSNNSKSAQGIPAQYSNAFEWARDWAKLNGMTLPPDNGEYRSLRNWFCFKLNQFKKGKLGESNEVLLAHYGLDFNLYEANQTGRGAKLSDITHTRDLLQYKQESGTYNLRRNAPDTLIQWQASILKRFAEAGLTRRMADIQRRVPDLHFGTWRAPDELPLLPKEEYWWSCADAYEKHAKQYPAINGEHHPDMPQAQRFWGDGQKQLLPSGLLPQRAKGWMCGVGLIPNPAMARNEARIDAKTPKALKDEKLHRYGVADARLTTIRGAIAFVEAVQEERSAKATMVRFKLTPRNFTILKALVLESGTKWTQKSIWPARLIALNDTKAFTPEWAQLLETHPHTRPSIYSTEAHSLGQLAYAICCRHTELKTTPKTKRTDPSTVEIAPPEEGRVLFKHCAQAYLETLATSVSPQSARGLKSAARKWLIPTLGDFPPETLDVNTVNRFIEKLELESTGPRGSLSQRTIGNIRNLLIHIVNYGRSQQRLEPIASREIVIGRGYKRAVFVDPFTKSEALRMLGLVREDYSNIMHAIMFSGLTVGRILRIQRSEVDTTGTTMNLDSCGKLANYPVDPKMLDSVNAELDRVIFNNPALYTGRTGSVIDLPNLRQRVLDPLQEHALVRPRDLKQFRYTAIMFWIEEGRSMEWIRARTGLQIKALMQDFVPYLSTFIRPSTGDNQASRMQIPQLRGIHRSAIALNVPQRT